MYLPAKIKAITYDVNDITIQFDVSGRNIYFTCSLNSHEWRNAMTKMHSFGSKGVSKQPEIGDSGEVELVNVKTAFGNIPAITNFR